MCRMYAAFHWYKGGNSTDDELEIYVKPICGNKAKINVQEVCDRENSVNMWGPIYAPQNKNAPQERS